MEVVVVPGQRKAPNASHPGKRAQGGPDPLWWRLCDLDSPGLDLGLPPLYHPNLAAPRNPPALRSAPSPREALRPHPLQARRSILSLASISWASGGPRCASTPARVLPWDSCSGGQWPGGEAHRSSPQFPPHQPHHGVHIVHQRLVPQEDLGTGALAIGKPVSILGHQILQSAGIEHGLEGPVGTGWSPPLSSPGPGHGQDHH